MVENDDNPYKSPKNSDQAAIGKRPPLRRRLIFARISAYCALGCIVTKFIALSYVVTAMQNASKGKTFIIDDYVKLAGRLEGLVMTLLVCSIIFAIPAVLKGNGLSRTIVLLACFAAFVFSLLMI